MKKLSVDHFIRLRRLVYQSARPLDYTKWKFLFENGSCEDFLSVLASYQNEDGGFGYNIECNNWNPKSSPYTVCIALDYLDTARDYQSNTKDAIIKGIIKYLASGIYSLESGWVGMQGIPSNNDFAHMPWFHFDPKKALEADIAVTKRLADFVLQYAEESSDIYQKAAMLKERYKSSGQVLIKGYPGQLGYQCLYILLVPQRASIMQSLSMSWILIWIRLLIHWKIHMRFNLQQRKN